MFKTPTPRGLAPIGLSIALCGAVLSISTSAQALDGGTDYTCATPLGNVTVPVHVKSDLLPTSVATGFNVPGGLLPANVSFTIPASFGGTLKAFGVSKIGGSSNDLNLGLGSTSVPLQSVTAAAVDIVDGADTVLTAAGTAGAFTTPSPGTKDITLPSTLSFVPVNQDGAALPTLACTLANPDAAKIGSILVLKQTSSTAAKAVKTSVKTSQRAVVKVTVSRQFGDPASGKVIAKRGTKTVGSGTLKSGKASIKLAKLKKGTAKIVLTYQGNGATTKSSSSVNLKVKKG